MNLLIALAKPFSAWLILPKWKWRLTLLSISFSTTVSFISISFKKAKIFCKLFEASVQLGYKGGFISSNMVGIDYFIGLYKVSYIYSYSSSLFLIIIKPIIISFLTLFYHNFLVSASFSSWHWAICSNYRTILYSLWL